MICGVNLNEAISPLLTNGVENNADSPERALHDAIVNHPLAVVREIYIVCYRRGRERTE